MRHNNAYKKLGRKTSHRKALKKMILNELFDHESIVTTLPKAKYFARAAEKTITIAKNGKTLHNFRQALSLLQNERITQKLFNDIAPRYAAIKGGYTRIYKLGGCRWLDDSRGKWAQNRLGDNGVRAILELTQKKAKEEPKAKAKTKTAVKKKK